MILALGTLPGALIAPYWPNDYGQDLDLWRQLTTASDCSGLGVGAPRSFSKGLTLNHPLCGYRA